MKLAIPTRNNVVDDHFGHCKTYTIITLDASNNIVNKEMLPSPQGCGCKSNIAAVLQKEGVTIMLAANMGNGALNVLNQHGIRVYRGCSGDVVQVVESYVNNSVQDSGLSCSHHEGEEHQCAH